MILPSTFASSLLDIRCLISYGIHPNLMADSVPRHGVYDLKCI